MIRKFVQFLSHERSLFFLLLILLIHIFVILPFGQQTTFGRIAIFVLYIFLLIVGLKYVTRNKTYPLILIAVAISTILLIVRFFSNQFWITISSESFIICYCALLGWVVLAKTFAEGPITVYRIEGSIVVYLLIALIFSNAYFIIYQLEGEISFKGLSQPDLKEFLYFSLTTLTTTGFGDISPAIPVSRSVTNMESLIGTLYPAILIARLVSMEFSNRSS
jgi:hypothetical protein